LSGPLLLDTNVLIRVLLDDKRMSSRAARALDRPGATLVVSVVSAWEIVLKHQAHKLLFRAGLSQILDEILYCSPWTILPVRPEHLAVLAGLPMLHSDPFDRMLIAQALHEDLAIVTSDQQIPKYNVRTLW
jgi:PIN domain nuclease of toxin-antitoxin system